LAQNIAGEALDQQFPMMALALALASAIGVDSALGGPFQQLEEEGGLVRVSPGDVPGLAAFDSKREIPKIVGPGQVAQAHREHARRAVRVQIQTRRAVRRFRSCPKACMLV
jgi:hypothetical protein